MTIKIIREILETHRDVSKQGSLTQKCDGCPWVGWDHMLHVAKTIDAALSEAVPEPPRQR